MSSKCGDICSYDTKKSNTIFHLELDWWYLIDLDLVIKTRNGFDLIFDTTRDTTSVAKKQIKI